MLELGESSLSKSILHGSGLSGLLGVYQMLCLISSYRIDEGRKEKIITAMTLSG
jgi:hypothetical protein